MLVSANCVVVGGGEFVIDLDDVELVGTLKNKIKEKQSLDRQPVWFDEQKQKYSFKRLETFTSISDESYFGMGFEEPRPGEVHVLVVLPKPKRGLVQEYFPSKRQKAMWTKSIGLDPRVSILPLVSNLPLVPNLPREEQKTWALDATAIKDFGLGHPGDQKMVLYCRDDAINEINFLQHKVLDAGVIGYILGPPGSGKSAAAAAFALAVAHSTDWVVTWIHLVCYGLPMCVRLEGNVKKTTTLSDPYGRKVPLLDVLNEVDSGKKHIVFLDGVAASDREQVVCCTGWLQVNRRDRRLVAVTSMSARANANHSDDLLMRVQEHFVSSWKLEEYFSAIEDDELFQIVSPYLDATDKAKLDDCDDGEVGWHQSLVRAKYYFAGGNASLMFNRSKAEVVILLKKAISALSYTGCFYNVINQLYGQFGESKHIISQFAGAALAIAGGPELVKRFTCTLGPEWNPTIMEWMLEMFFFTCIWKGGVKLSRLEKAPITWEYGTILLFDPAKSMPNVLAYQNGCWLKPEKYSPGGYDAVYVDAKRSLVRFVQVTSADSHAFYIDHFSKFLEYLRDSTSSFEVKTLDIFVVVEESKLPEFKICPVRGEGLLAAAKWEKGTEVERVQRVGIKGVYSWNGFAW